MGLGAASPASRARSPFVSVTAAQARSHAELDRGGLLRLANIVDPQLMQQEVTDILDEVRAQIARGVEPDAVVLEERVRALDPKALPRLRRLLAVHRAKRSVREPPRPAPAPRPRATPPAYRAKPTITANVAVHARAQGEAVVLEWDAPRGVGAWEVRVGERRDARSQYVDRETVQLPEPRYQLELTDLPLRVSVVGRNASGRIVQRALISGLTRSNWSQKWQQRASAS